MIMRWLPVTFFLASCALALAAILSIPAVVDIMRGEQEPYRVTIQAPPMTKIHYYSSTARSPTATTTPCGHDPRRTSGGSHTGDVDAVTCPQCIAAMLRDGSPQMTLEQIGTLAARALHMRDYVPGRESSRRSGPLDVYQHGRWRVTILPGRSMIRIMVQRRRGDVLIQEYRREARDVDQAQRRLGRWIMDTRTEAHL